jgi:hypothetical protein
MLHKTTKIIKKLIEESNSIQEKKSSQISRKDPSSRWIATILTGLVILHINDLNPIRTTNSRARKMIHVK